MFPSFSPESVQAALNANVKLSQELFLGQSQRFIDWQLGQAKAWEAPLRSTWEASKGSYEAGIDLWKASQKDWTDRYSTASSTTASNSAKA